MPREHDAAAIRAWLVQRVAETLGIDRAEIDPRSSFTALGLGSLQALGLSGELAEWLGRELPPALLYEHASLEQLAEHLAGTVGSAREHCAGTAGLEQDAALDPEIVPAPVSGRRRGGSILLTGATGHLGAFLLHELLARTPADVCCLVRAGGALPGIARIAANLERHGLRRSDLQRITVITGDLARPGLGLPGTELERLRREVGTILHCGAVVSYVHPYEELRAANVLATRELLRLSCAGGGIPFHFVSSLAVCCPTEPVPGGVAFEASFAADCEHLELGRGYARTKWVAERLLRSAGEAGVPVTIYRPGMITAPARGPAAPFADLVLRIVRACLEAGCAPELELDVDLTPADHAGAAIAHLATREQLAASVFHVCNPEPVRWRDCIAWLAARGATIELVPFRHWLERLSGSDTGRALLPFLSQRSGRGAEHVLQRYSAAGFPRFDAANTSNALVGTGIACPPARSLLPRYLAPLLAEHAAPAARGSAGSTHARVHVHPVE